MGKLYNNITNMRRLERQRKPNRLRHFDYSQTGWYFVTVCVKGRECIFGDIKNGQMFLNERGEIAKTQWLWLTKQYNYVGLDEWIIMPNHIHGIVMLQTTNCRERSRPFPTKILPLWNIIGAFKTTSSKFIHQSGLPHFQWQRSFYDHIIRNEYSFQQIREYIRLNPLKWDLDENHPKNVKSPYAQS